MEPIVLRVSKSANPGSEYLRLSARIMTLATDGTPRNITAAYSPAIEPTAPFYGIAATAQADRAPDYGRDYSYAWAVGFAPDYGDVASVEQCEMSTRTLRRIRGAMNRAEARYGPPATFGAYVARVADALRCPVLVGDAGPDDLYSSGEWQQVPSGAAARIVDGWIRAHRA